MARVIGVFSFREEIVEAPPEGLVPNVSGSLLGFRLMKSRRTGVVTVLVGQQVQFEAPVMALNKKDFVRLQCPLDFHPGVVISVRIDAKPVDAWLWLRRSRPVR